MNRPERTGDMRGTIHARKTIRGSIGYPTLKGEPGEDGFSPQASVTKSGNTATITITDKSGTTTAQVTDGARGDAGRTPEITANRIGDTTTIYSDSTPIAEIHDGTPGQDGTPAIIDATPTEDSPNAVSSGGVYDELTDVKNDLNELNLSTGMAVRPIFWSGNDEYFNIGSSTTPLEPVSRSGYQYIKLSCAKDYLFIVNSSVESGIRGWAFVTSDGTNIISGFGATNKLLVAPENAAWLVINNRKGYGDGTPTYIGQYTPDYVDQIMKGVCAPIRMQKEMVGENSQIISYNSSTNTISLNSRANGGSNLWRYAIVPCLPGDKFTLNCTGGGLPRAYAFTTRSGSVVEVSAASVTLTDHVVTAPNNSAFLVINDNSDRTSYYGEVPSYVERVINDVETISGQVDALGGEIDTLGDDISELTDGVSDLRMSTGEAVRPVFWSGKNQYINIGSSTTNLTPETREGYQYAKIPCAENDIFVVNASVDSGIRAWGFVAADGTNIYQTNGNTANDVLVVAPTDAAWFIINNKSANNSKQSYIGLYTPEYIANMEKGIGAPIQMRTQMSGQNYLYIAYYSNTNKVDLNGRVNGGATECRFAIVKCSEGDKFTINAEAGTGFQRAYAFTQRDGTVVSISDSATYENYVVTAPAGSVYLVLNDKSGKTSYYGEPLTSQIAQVESEIEALEDRIYTDTVIQLGGTNQYINLGISDLTQPVNLSRTYSMAGCKYAIIDCSPGDQFLLNVVGGTYPRAYGFLDSSNLILERADQDTSYSDHIITAPANTAKLVVNDKNGGNIPSYYGSGSISYRVTKLEDTSARGRLTGKVLVSFGDSIFGRGQGALGIPGRIAYKTGATAYNIGMSGTSFSTRNSLPGYDPFNFWRMVDAITTNTYTDQDSAIAGSAEKPGQAANVIAFLKTFDFSTVDYVTIGLGTNDWGGSQTLDNTNNLYDKSTVCGALRYGIETLLTAFPKAIIVILSTIPRFDISGGVYTDKGANSGGYTLQDMNAKLKEVADSYHLKYVDDFNVGFNKFTASQYYATNDGTHPDIAGFEVLAENIASNI